MTASKAVDGVDNVYDAWKADRQNRQSFCWIRSNAGVPNGFRTLWDKEYSQGYEGGLGFQPFDSAFVIHSISFGARENRPFFNKLAITMVSPI